MFRNGLAGFQVQSQKQKQKSCTKCRNINIKPCIENEHSTNALQVRNAVVRQPNCDASRERGKVAVYKTYYYVFLYQV